MSALKQFKCSVFNPDVSCSYSVTGEEEYVVDQSIGHEVKEHGMEDTPQLEKDIRDSLIDVNGN